MSSPTEKGAVVGLGSESFAYVQSGGSWGWSNAGLVTADGASLLIDTLFDQRLTARMLQELRRLVPAAHKIETLVNTHADGDHTYGNKLVEGARIVTSTAVAEDIANGVQPAQFVQMLAGADKLGDLGRFLVENFGAFEFDGIDMALPTETFDGTLSMYVGSKEVRLTEVGPAHTRGDVIVHVPADRVLFTGDILFNGSHPVVWAGPVSHWIAACDLIAGLDVESVVPGHGPLATLADVAELRAYFVYLVDTAAELRDQGMDPWQAARHIKATNRWANWGDSERLLVNIAQIYQEFGDPPTFASQLEGLTALASFHYGNDKQEGRT